MTKRWDLRLKNYLLETAASEEHGHKTMKPAKFSSHLKTDHSNELKDLGYPEINPLSLQTFFYRNLPQYAAKQTKHERAYSRRKAKGIRLRGYSEKWFCAGLRQRDGAAK